MAMRMTFDDCCIVGAGSDQDGPFTLSGVYDPGTETVQILKAYPTLLVCYEGSWNGRFINGVSVIGHPIPVDLGTFEMWPESEETTLDQLMGEADETTFLVIPAS
jgi:hypothetical protein